MITSAQHRKPAHTTLFYWLMSIAFVSSLAFCVLAALVANGTTHVFDEAVLQWINTYASPAFDAAFLAITKLGDALFVTVVGLVILGILLYKKLYHKALFIMLGIGIPVLLSVLLKPIFNRSRPDLWEWLVVETSHSFPSGHATASMALALCCVGILWYTKWRTVMCVSAGIYALLIGTSRLYLGVHFPTDILGGWLLSLACVTAIAAGIYAYRHRTQQRIAS